MPNRLLLGRVWRSTLGGDARLGNLLYGLWAVYHGLFQGDHPLLRTCSQIDRLPRSFQQNFPHIALSVLLLHQLPMPAT